MLFVWQTTFTHGDLQRKNIVVSNVTSEAGGEDGKVAGDFKVTIIDWEVAGWYPSYWEFSRALFACGRWDDDWHEWVGKALRGILE